MDNEDSLPLMLLRLLEADDIDGAIRAGLMEYRPDRDDDHLSDCQPPLSQQLAAAQHKLASAWAARERYRQRQARLARRAQERDNRRAAFADKAGQTSTLPPAAAAALARAKARAAERGKP